MGTLFSRFTAKCIPEPNTGCWFWIGSLDHFQYGRACYQGKIVKAHRLSWMLFKNEWPNLCVLHKCDTPWCVNPDHLFLGTQQDNINDCMKKGRSPRAKGERNGANTAPEMIRKGELNGGHKLMETQIIEIRIRHAAGESMRGLARTYGVNQRTIGRVVHRTHWRSVK